MFFESHCHTVFSCEGNLSIAKIVDECKRKNVSIIAITDHNTIRGGVELSKTTPQLQVIIGEEVDTQQGEIIGYFLKEGIQPRLDIGETVTRIKRQGGLVCVPHPFDRFRRKVIRRESLRRYIQLIDLIEVFNSRNILERDNIRAAAFAKQHGKIAIVGSDAHFAGEIARAVTDIGDFNGPQELLEKLRSGSFHCERSPLYYHALTLLERFRQRLVII